MITATDIDFAFKNSPQILHQVSARVAPGSFMAILGNNGVGKSTFMFCLNRILQPTGGKVELKTGGVARDVADMTRMELARNMAFVAQHSHAGRLTVFDAVLLGRRPHINFSPTDKDYRLVEKSMARMGIDDLAGRYVDELSGGEFQKVILARALAQDASILLLDEPTNNLDPHNQYEVMRAVREVIDADQISAIAVLHDLNLAVRFCDTFVLLKEGTVYAHGGIETITPETLHAVYGINADVIEHKGHKVVVTL
ncbi:ABC transporter ATP-binding protein [Corynebacterium cystitidis]|uniref:ABC transporter ATP-binding protein n=1 Tax=Corynebacterium cystitidis TaxID=35757 RepID=UPI00211E9980|nr:ABC transporter ATP-binding protein [Corynebacterium cystitidis]